MQNVDIKSLEQEIRDESKVCEIYFSTASEYATMSDLVLIERNVMNEFNKEKCVPFRTRMAIAWAATQRASELIKASTKNYRKAEIHRRRLQRLMSRYDALVERVSDMGECLNITCRNFDPHNHGEDCDDFCQTCNTPISQRPRLETVTSDEQENSNG